MQRRGFLSTLGALALLPALPSPLSRFVEVTGVKGLTDDNTFVCRLPGFAALYEPTEIRIRRDERRKVKRVPRTL